MEKRSLSQLEIEESPFESVELTPENDTASVTSNTSIAISPGSPPPNSSSITHQKEDAVSTNTVSRRIKWLCSSPKFLVGLLLVGFITYVVVDAFTAGRLLDAVQDFLGWIQNNLVAGVFSFVVVYSVATVVFLPTSLLTLGSGFVFSMALDSFGGGVALGVLSVFVGASLGATVSFFLGRYLLRDQVGNLSKQYAVFQALDQALHENGLKIFVLLRLSPIIPFSAVNYLGGASAVSLRDYLLALFASLPGTTLYVFLGASAGSLADSAVSGQDSTLTIVIAVVGAVVGLLTIGLTTRYARQELARVVAEERKQEQQHGIEESDLEGQAGVVDVAKIGGDVAAVSAAEETPKSLS